MTIDLPRIILHLMLLFAEMKTVRTVHDGALYLRY